MRGFFLALHAATPVALAAAVLLQLWAPAWLAPLAQRPQWPLWALIGLWLLAALAGTALRALVLWRTALCATAAALLLAAATGLARGAPLAGAMLAALAALALSCIALAAFIGPQRLRANRRCTPAPRVAAANGAQPAAQRPPRPALALRARAWHVLWRGRSALRAQLPFWISGLLALQALRLAQTLPNGPARAVAMLGLLLAFFLTLPAATLRNWAPRSSSLLWAVAALAYGALALKAAAWPPALAAALCAGAAADTLLRRNAQRVARSQP